MIHSMMPTGYWLWFQLGAVYRCISQSRKPRWYYAVSLPYFRFSYFSVVQDSKRRMTVLLY